MVIEQRMIQVALSKASKNTIEKTGLLEAAGSRSLNDSDENSYGDRTLQKKYEAKPNASGGNQR